MAEILLNNAGNNLYLVKVEKKALRLFVIQTAINVVVVDNISNIIHQNNFTSKPLSYIPILSISFIETYSPNIHYKVP